LCRCCSLSCGICAPGRMGQTYANCNEAANCNAKGNPFLISSRISFYHLLSYYFRLRRIYVRRVLKFTICCTCSKELGISHRFLIYFQARCKSAEIKMGKYVQVCTHIYRNYCSQLSHKLNAVHEIIFRMIQKLTSIVCIYFFSET